MRYARSTSPWMSSRSRTSSRGGLLVERTEHTVHRGPELQGGLDLSDGRPGVGAVVDVGAQLVGADVGLELLDVAGSAVRPAHAVGVDGVERLGRTGREVLDVVVPGAVEVAGEQQLA